MLNNRATFTRASTGEPSKEPDLIFAIRSDANHATRDIVSHATEYLLTQPHYEKIPYEKVESEASSIIKNAYKSWRDDVVGIMAKYIDGDKYKLPENSTVEASYYSSKKLKNKAVENAVQLAGTMTDIPPVMVSLDDMIGGSDEHWAEIAFSRHFSLEGDSHFGYVGRPTKQPIEEQLQNLALHLKTLKEQYGGNIPIVLMEDNVRRAQMLNWVIGLMDDYGVFENADLAGISTCFCCANDEEQANIKHNGKEVPVSAVLHFGDKNTDVITPRDLLVDGYVVMADETMCRLPAVYMDVASLMKINPEQADAFKLEVIERNIEFCEELEIEFGCDVPLEWFIGATAISHVADIPLDTRMATAMEKLETQIMENIAGDIVPEQAAAKPSNRQHRR